MRVQISLFLIGNLKNKVLKQNSEFVKEFLRINIFTILYAFNLFLSNTNWSKSVTKVNYIETFILK